MKKNQAQAQETTNTSAASAATTVTEIKEEEKKDDDNDVAMGQVRPKETAPEIKKVDNVATSAASASAAAA